MGIRGASERQEDCFAIGLLAGLDVIPKQQLESVEVVTGIDLRNLSTVKEIWVVRESGAFISRVGKVCNRRSYAVHECNRDNLASPSVPVNHEDILNLTSISVSESKGGFEFSCSLRPISLSFGRLTRAVVGKILLSKGAATLTVRVLS